MLKYNIFKKVLSGGGHDFKKNCSPLFQRKLEQAYRLPIGQGL
jgi:hypothetical protein